MPFVEFLRSGRSVACSTEIILPKEDDVVTVTMSIAAKPRTKVGKGYVRRLRREGSVPGVLYGGKAGSQPIEVSARELERVLTLGGVGQLVDVLVGGERHTALIKEVVRDSTKDFIIHVDLHEVDMNVELQTVVPLALTGEEERANDGGFINQLLREVQISCLPRAIPEQVTVDVSQLGIGENLTVADLELPEGVTVLTDPETVVATVVAARAAGSAEEEGADEEAAPEAAEEETEEA